MAWPLLASGKSGGVAPLRRFAMAALFVPGGDSCVYCVSRASRASLLAREEGGLTGGAARVSRAAASQSSWSTV